MISDQFPVFLPVVRWLLNIVDRILRYQRKNCYNRFPWGDNNSATLQTMSLDAEQGEAQRLISGDEMRVNSFSTRCPPDGIIDY